LLTWREDALDGEGRRIRLKRTAAIGSATLTRKEAAREAGENWLPTIDRINARPASAMTVTEFVEARFIPQWVRRLKPSGQDHYKTQLKPVLAAIGAKRLCDVTPDDVEGLISDQFDAGLAAQTVLHRKNCVSAIFHHAKRLRMYRDENPAEGVTVGEVVHEKRPTLTWERARRAVCGLATPYREMALLSMATSMGAAELAGLRQRWCNLTDGIVTVEGQVLAPHSVAVRENWYAGRRGSLKTGRRCRNLPITSELSEMIRDVVARARVQDPEAPVFQGRTGKPVDAHNASNRYLRPLGKRLGFPVTWYAFRRAHSTFAGQVPGLALEDRRATMGHADAELSLYYSVQDIERRRAIPARIMEQLMGKTEGGVQ